MLRAAAVLIRFALGKRLASLACPSGSSRFQNPRPLGGLKVHKNPRSSVFWAHVHGALSPLPGLLSWAHVRCALGPLSAPCQVFCLLGLRPLRPQPPVGPLPGLLSPELIGPVSPLPGERGLGRDHPNRKLRNSKYKIL